MSKAGAGPFPPLLRFADILFVNGVLDENGGNLKVRRVVVVTPDAALAADHPIVAAPVTTTLPPQLTADHVALPFKNPPGTRHPKTGLTMRAAVKRTWIMTVQPHDIREYSGFVPGSSMGSVRVKTAARARQIGGWR